MRVRVNGTVRLKNVSQTCQLIMHPCERSISKLYIVYSKTSVQFVSTFNFRSLVVPVAFRVSVR